MWALLSRLLSLLGLPRFPPYSVWSTAHDQVIQAPALLAQLPDPAAAWNAHLHATQDLRANLFDQATSLGAALPGQGIALTLLVDHSAR